MSKVDHRQQQYNEQDVSGEVIDEEVECSLSQVDFLRADDKVSAGRLVVGMLSQVVYHQPAKDVTSI